MVTLRYQDELVVRAPRDRVFSACLDLDAAKNWMNGLVSIERLDAGPMVVGSKWREVRKMFGKEAAEVFELTSLEPGQTWTLRVDGTQGSTGKGQYVFTYHLDDQSLGGEGPSTKLRLDAEIDMPGGLFTSLMMKIFAGTFKKAVRKDHEALKAFIEGATN